MRLGDRGIALIVGAVGAIAYLAAGFGLVTDYDYYGRLAAAFVDGRWWLQEAPSWLNELLTCGAGRFCVAYPPLPAVLAVPLVPFLAPAAAQVVVSRIAGGAAAGLLYHALRGLGAPRAYAIAGALLSTFGTTLFFSSVDGRAWYAAHAVAMLFLSASFDVAVRGGSPFAIGALLGLAALARLPVGAAFPALTLIGARRASAPLGVTLARVVAGGAPLAAIYLGYDLLRWGTPLDAGYARLTEGDFFFNHGLFSPLYLPRHLYAIFIAPPELVEGTPFFLRPRFEGMSLFLTTPAFLWLFAGLREVRRDVAIAATAAAALLALIPDLFHGTVGFQQFGYRFSIDAQPFLVTLSLAGDGLAAGAWRRRPGVLFIVAIAISIVINVYATIAITRFDYWR